MRKGFIHGYLLSIFAILFIIVCAYAIGKLIPTGEVVLRDPVAERYESAGIEKPIEEMDLQLGRSASGNQDANYGITVQNSNPDQRNVEVDVRPEDAYISLPHYESQPDDAETSGGNTVTNASANSNLNSNSSNSGDQSAPTPTPTIDMKTFTSKLNSRISFQYPSDARVNEEKKGESVVGFFK
jgi:hypothetical protein